MRKVTIWSKCDVDYLRTHHSNQLDGVIANVLGKTASAVRHKRCRLGLSACPHTRKGGWSAKEDAFVAGNPLMGLREIAGHLGRSMSAVSHRRKHLGMRTPQSDIVWSPAEDKILRMHQEAPFKSLTTRLNRTPLAIRQRRRQLGLTRPKNIYIPTAADKRSLLEHMDDPEPMSALRGKIPSATDAQIWRQLKKLGRRRRRRKGYTIMNGHRYKTVNGKLMAEHRIVAQNAIGRPLKNTEVVHHIDCNPINNDPANLDILPDDSTHARTHASLDKLIGKLFQASIVHYDKRTNKYELVQ